MEKDIADLTERVHALEALRDDIMLASEHGVRLIALIEGFSDAIAALQTQVNFLEVQLAAAQRANTIAN